MALIVTLRGSNYCCLEQIFMVPKGFEPSKFDCMHQIERNMKQVLVSVAQLDGHPTGDQEVAGSNPAGSATFFHGDLIMKYFLQSFSPFR